MARVGGTFWGRQVSVDASKLVRRVPDANARAIDARFADCPADVVIWDGRRGRGSVARGDVDVWHLLDQVQHVAGSARDAFLLLAAAAGKTVEAIGVGPFADIADWSTGDLDEALGAHAVGVPGGEAMPLGEVIDLLVLWRDQIAANRDIAGVLGIAQWKRPATDVLLWNGHRAVPYLDDATAVPPGGTVVTWSSKMATTADRAIATRSLRRIEIEDGFVRSVGLGVNCVPPLSVVLDPLGAHFDPSKPSLLEQLLCDAHFTESELTRASALRQRLVTHAITKYAAGIVPRIARPSPRPTVLVVGQVENDRSVLLGGDGIATNLELLRRVRAEEPDAFIVYKPHPDVETGLRPGLIPEHLVMQVADVVDRTTSIASLIDVVDAVHVLTSLAGFEALLRGREVVTHGVPFYAGWGLTRDLGNVPGRRTRRLTLDELGAATLLRYPRYLDPLTGWPCPVETTVSRLERGEGIGRRGMLPRLRELQGQIYRQITGLRELRHGA